jgi:hypothetical protein
MDEKDFKKHLKDLAHGHHHPEEHDWEPGNMRLVEALKLFHTKLESQIHLTGDRPAILDCGPEAPFVGSLRGRGDESEVSGCQPLWRHASDAGFVDIDHDVHLGGLSRRQIRWRNRCHLKDCLRGGVARPGNLRRHRCNERWSERNRHLESRGGGRRQS